MVCWFDGLVAGSFGGLVAWWFGWKIGSLEIGNLEIGSLMVWWFDGLEM